MQSAGWILCFVEQNRDAAYFIISIYKRGRKSLRRVDAVMSSKLYEVKRQYPIVKHLVKGVCTVERELNKDMAGKCGNKMREFH